MTDATAAIGMARRRGLGKVRLWIQDRLRKKEFKLEKSLGVRTLRTCSQSMLIGRYSRKHMAKLGLHLEGGRASSAPSINH